MSQGVPESTQGYGRFEDWAIAAMLAGSIATQFRFTAQGEGIGAGIPEMLIGVWASGRIIYYLKRVGRRENLAFVLFILTLFVFGGVAVLNGLAAGRYSHDSQRDLIAMTANAALAIALVVTVTSRVRALHLLTCVGVALAAINLIAIVMAQLGLSIGNVYFYDPTSHRFFGFTANPNQVALAAVVSIGAILSGIGVWRGWFRRIFFSCLLLGSVWAGYISDSDAFRVSVFVFSLLLLFGLLIVHVRRRQVGFLLSSGVIAFFALGIAFTLIFATERGAIFRELAASIYYGDDDHGSVRILLWQNGLRALAESNMLGFGPGSFSGMTGPFEKMESHNSFIDLATNIGLGGAILVLLSMVIVLYRAYFITPIVFAFVGMLFTFMLFHHVLRHFIFWAPFALMFIIVRFGSPIGGGLVGDLDANEAGWVHRGRMLRGSVMNINRRS